LTKTDLLEYLDFDTNKHEGEFKFDQELLDKIDIIEYNKIIFIQWNNTINHNLIKKIADRSEINSISELNEIFERSIKEIIPKEIGYGITRTGDYDIYLKNRNIHIIVELDYDELFTIEDYVAERNPLLFSEISALNQTLSLEGEKTAQQVLITTRLDKPLSDLNIKPEQVVDVGFEVATDKMVQIF